MLQLPLSIGRSSSGEAGKVPFRALTPLLRRSMIFHSARNPHTDHRDVVQPIFRHWSIRHTVHTINA